MLKLSVILRMMWTSGSKNGWATSSHASNGCSRRPSSRTLPLPLPRRLPHRQVHPPSTSLASHFRHLQPLPPPARDPLTSCGLARPLPIRRLRPLPSLQLPQAFAPVLLPLNCSPVPKVRTPREQRPRSWAAATRIGRSSVSRQTRAPLDRCKAVEVSVSRWSPRSPSQRLPRTFKK